MKQYLGKTVLFSVNLASHEGEVLEGEVQGLTPSGKYVSIGYSWYAVGNVTVLEVLPDAPTNKPLEVPVQASEPAAPAVVVPMPGSGTVAPTLPSAAPEGTGAPAPGAGATVVSAQASEPAATN